MNKSKDMTKGEPVKLILGFAMPMLFGILFQQLYSMVDTIIVGKYLSVDALAGVGSTGSINFMINGFVIGVSSGFTIPVAQRFGAKDYKDMRKFIGNIIWLYLLFALGMTFGVSVMTKNILLLTKTPDDIIYHAYQYIFYIFLGIPVTYLYNILAGLIRSVGDSKTPVYFLVISSFINIALDIVFILFLHMGVEGAAFATVISQLISAMLCLLYINKKFELLKPSREERRFSKRHAITLCTMGVPMGLQYSITAIGSVTLQTAINNLGAAAVAGVTAGSRIFGLLATPLEALGATMATYAGQNIGAGRVERIREGVKKATIIGILYGIVAAVFLYFFGDEMTLLFLDANQVEIIKQAHLYMVVGAIFFSPLVVVLVWRFTIQGMGYSVFAIATGIMEMVGRIFISLLAPYFGFVVIVFSSPIAWLLANAFLIPAFLHLAKKSEEHFAKQVLSEPYSIEET